MANGPDEQASSAAAARFKLKRTLTGHKRAVTSLKFSPVKPELLASASADGTLELWNVNDGSRVSPAQPMAHNQGINEIAWNPEGRYLASVSDDVTVKLWDAETGACLRTLTGHTHYVYCCQFDPPGHILVSRKAGPRSAVRVDQRIQ
jgi:COMPASS component SWD3